MLPLDGPTLIGVFGWPFSGKTTLADEISQRLGVHCVDINNLRVVNIGKPHDNPNESPEAKKRDGQEMGGSYRFLFTDADWHLEMRRSLIIVCTLSRKKGGQTTLMDICMKHPLARQRFIQCIPQDDADDEVEQRIKKAREQPIMTPWGPYKDPVNTLERYLEVKNRYNPLEIPHIKISTWGSANTVEDEARIALEYILRSQMHDFPEITP